MPEGVTKVVVATNIAETSITIDDVVRSQGRSRLAPPHHTHITHAARPCVWQVHVIDAGRVKELG
jgi:hypothetical protein